MCVFRQQDLYRILKAYTIYRPDEGYCQAQAPVAAVLLMHMPAEVRQLNSLGCCTSLIFFKKEQKNEYMTRVISQEITLPPSSLLFSSSKPSGVLCKSVRNFCLATTVLGWWVTQRLFLGAQRKVFIFYKPLFLLLSCSSGGYSAGRRDFFLSSEESVSHGLPSPEEI